MEMLKHRLIMYAWIACLKMAMEMSRCIKEESCLRWQRRIFPAQSGNFVFESEWELTIIEV